MHRLACYEHLKCNKIITNRVNGGITHTYMYYYYILVATLILSE